MKVKFKIEEMKVLITRISGKFKIQKEDGSWSKPASGSFKVTDSSLYNQILEKISNAQTVYMYALQDYPGGTKHITNINEYFDLYCYKIHARQENLIFDVDEGLIKSVELVLHKDNFSKSKYDKKQWYVYTTINWIDEVVLSELPVNVYEALKKQIEKEGFERY